MADNCNVSPGNNNVKLTGAAIVNGCQTVTTLSVANKDGKLISSVTLPIRIIKTGNPKLRSIITEKLNSQNSIRSSYFLGNSPFIRKLQENLLTKKYFFERSANEYEFKLSLNKIEEYPKENVLYLEKTIQLFVAYYIDELAAKAKSGLGELFDKRNADEILPSLDADKVIYVTNLYREVSSKISLYRKCRRQNKNIAFLKYMGYSTDIDDITYEIIMGEYIFVHTADLLILNMLRNMDNNIPNDIKIRKCIETIHSVANDERFIKMTPSGLTKNAGVFEECQKRIRGLAKLDL